MADSLSKSQSQTSNRPLNLHRVDTCNGCYYVRISGKSGGYVCSINSGYRVEPDMICDDHLYVRKDDND